MDALLVSECGEVIRSTHENLSLVNTTKLSVNTEVLLIKNLEQWVQKSREKWVLNLYLFILFK